MGRFHHGIRINTVNPTGVNTRMAAEQAPHLEDVPARWPRANG